LASVRWQNRNSEERHEESELAKASPSLPFAIWDLVIGVFLGFGIWDLDISTVVPPKQGIVAHFNSPYKL
jgi:hypothetical protein